MFPNGSLLTELRPKMLSAVPLREEMSDSVGLHEVGPRIKPIETKGAEMSHVVGRKTKVGAKTSHSGKVYS